MSARVMRGFLSGQGGGNVIYVLRLEKNLSSRGSTAFASEAVNNISVSVCWQRVNKMGLKK